MSQTDNAHLLTFSAQGMGIIYYIGSGLNQKDVQTTALNDVQRTGSKRKQATVPRTWGNPCLSNSLASPWGC